MKTLNEHPYAVNRERWHEQWREEINKLTQRQRESEQRQRMLNTLVAIGARRKLYSEGVSQ